MGVVWKARDEETGQIVALKLLREVYAEDPDYVTRFERELDLEMYDPSRGTFSWTGSMSVARAGAAAVTLPNGLVLVAGGYSNQAFTPTAELFDPTSGKFTLTGSMATPRAHAAAILLSSGRVLIAGGDEELPSGGMVNPTSAELYDPATGTFSSTGSMSSGQARAAATLLADGRVLIAGGSVWSASPGYAVSVSSAEIYDPSSGAFHSVGPMASAREDPVAALLADGSALVAGGRSASGGDLGVTLSSVELFDPSTERFTAGPSMATDRAEATTSRPPDGRILIAGGYELAGGGYYYLASSEIYEPGSGSFAEGPAMVAGRSGARSTTLQDGSVLIAGGFGVSDTGFGGLYSAELYRP